MAATDETEGSFLKCKGKNKLSPMDINFPMKHASKKYISNFVDFNLTMSLNTANQIEWRKYEHNQIGFFGKWGKIIYQTLKYKIERVDVVAPSVHMVSHFTQPSRRGFSSCFSIIRLFV